MVRFLSQTLIMLGCLCLGFGTGIWLTVFIELTQMQFALLIIGFLVLGGFLIGLGILRKPVEKKKEEKERKEEEKEETPPGV